jgi:two-component system NarL family sensor kinase
LSRRLSIGRPSRSADPAETALRESERRVAWLRIAAIPLIVVAQSLPHPDPEHDAFVVTVVIVSVYAVAVLVWAYTRPVSRSFALAATAADVAAITVLAVLSGGAYSEARLTYFLIPIAVAFRFQPSLTALASAVTVIAYLTQALAHPAAKLPDASRFIAVQAGYLVWLGAAAVLLSAVLERRTRRVAELADSRQRLIAEAQTAEERERRALADGLHDHAIQNLLSVRHELDEAADSAGHPALGRADTTLAETISALRDAVFELHPYVLDQAGLEAALRAVAQRAAGRGGFELHFDLSYDGPHEHERLLLSAARELLTNAARHARAGAVSVELHERGDDLVLVVSDDGQGFDPRILPARLAEGHVGLQSQRERIESVGGRLELRSAPGAGTGVTVRLPA